MPFAWPPSSRDAAGEPLLAEPEIPSSQPAPGRRERTVDGGDRVLLDAVAQKVLHGWLQNRHQTLYPLTVNFRSIEAGQRATLAAWMAVASLATAAATPDRHARARAWLAGVGADADTLDRLDASLAAPPALSQVLARIAEDGLAAYAYVLALVAADPADAATPPFLDYVAARLGLPTTVVRSAVRRYRR